MGVLSSKFSLDDIEAHRRELTGYCYRMLGSAFEAEDAVQETVVRAWRNVDTFEGRAALRSWVYRIATNVCLDMLRGRSRRARPMDMGPVRVPDEFKGDTLPEHAWLTPVPDGKVIDVDGDPAEVAAARESIRLAFVATLQHLPAKQRAVLILCEVLRWQATEVAELLDTTVASVNSALQRARATLAERSLEESHVRFVDPDQEALLARYVDAFERYDVSSLVTMLKEDAIMTMPPYDFWLRGSKDIAHWFLNQGIACRGSRLVATMANGQPAFASYKIHPAGGWAPWSVQVLDVREGVIVGHHNFLDTSIYGLFGLPLHLDPVA